MTYYLLKFMIVINSQYVKIPVNVPGDAQAIIDNLLCNNLAGIRVVAVRNGIEKIVMAARGPRYKLVKSNT